MDTYNYEGYGRCDIDAPDFFSVAKVGTPAPDVSLTALDGERVFLADFKDRKHVVLEFGSIT
jgi:peroxiredoxin